ncbi:MAG TPA: hypothetical protein VGO62_10120 [Myxococcota bacterium]
MTGCNALALAPPLVRAVDVRDDAREDRDRMRPGRAAHAHGLDVDVIDALFERVVAWTRDRQRRE